MIVTAVVALAPTQAWACVTGGQPEFGELLETGRVLEHEVVGFYEQEHVADIPGLSFFVNDRSASVVIRYWGEPPNLSVASHGDEGVFLPTSTSCGSPARASGYVVTQASVAGSADQPRGAGPGLRMATGFGSPNASEIAALTERFGAAVEVSLGPDDWVVAYGLLLWRPVVVFGTYGAIAYALIRRARFKSPRRATLDRPTLAAAAVGLTVLTIATPSYGIVDWFGLTLALAGSVFLGWILRVPWTAFSVGYAIYFAMRPDPLFVDLYGDDRRLQTSVGAMIIGAGVLVWSRNHWTRFVSSFMVVSGASFYVLGSAEVRQYDNLPAAIGVAFIVAGATAFAVWRLVFRDRGLKPASIDTPDAVAVGVQTKPSA